MAINAVESGSQATVGKAMSRRRAVTLTTQAVAGLLEQSVVGRSMRLVTFDSATPVGQVHLGHRVLVQEGSR